MARQTSRALVLESPDSGAMRLPRVWICLCVILVGAFAFCVRAAVGAEPPSDLPPFPRPTDGYNDEHVADLWQRLAGRVAAEPFNLVATVIFVLAICHTFLASRFLAIAHRYERAYDA